MKQIQEQTRKQKQEQAESFNRHVLKKDNEVREEDKSELNSADAFRVTRVTCKSSMTF
jgi:hypothetical protein